MIPLARRMVLRDRARVVVTSGGVAITVSLLLFLLGVHEGVRDGSTRYVRTVDVDIWVAQKDSNNLLKTSSFLPERLVQEVASVPGVQTASPLVRLITRPIVGDRRASTLFLFGYDMRTTVGAPTTLVAGTIDLKPRELIVDRAFADKYDLADGDTVTIARRSFRIAGISEGTNALVSQYGFLRSDDAAEISGLPGVISYVVVRVQPGADRIAVADAIFARLPDTSVYDRDEFAANNLEEMETGVLPVFATIALVGSIAGGFLVALMLYTAVIEHREEYATLKAIGAPQSFLLRLIARQSMIGCAIGFVAGCLLSLAMTPILKAAVPELTIRFTPLTLLAVLGGTMIIGLIGAVIPIQALRRIYPAEVFRA